MPQEIEVWYLIPALRKELAQTLIKDHDLKQNEVAKILGVTEAAVSQYLKSKRAQELKFTTTEKQKIKEIAKLIIKDKENITKYMYELCVAFRGHQNMCDLHRRFDKNIAKDCKICCQ